MPDPIESMLSEPSAEKAAAVEPSAPQPAPAAEPAKPQAQTPPQPAAAAAPTPSPSPLAANESATKPIDPGHVPIAAMLDEREKRQKLERELDALRKQHAPKPAPPPSPYDDPEAYARFIDSRMEERERNMRFNFSEERAEEKHGKPLLDEAKAWGEKFVQAEAMQGETRFVDALFKQPKPFEWLIAQFKRDKLLKDVGDDPDAYVRRRYAELNAPAAPAAPGSPQSAPQAKPFVAPKSIAGVPSAGGGGARSIPVGPGQAFEAEFTN